MNVVMLESKIKTESRYALSLMAQRKRIHIDPAFSRSILKTQVTFPYHLMRPHRWHHMKKGVTHFLQFLFGRNIGKNSFVLTMADFNKLLIEASQYFLTSNNLIEDLCKYRDYENLTNSRSVFNCDIAANASTPEHFIS